MNKEIQEAQERLEEKRKVMKPNTLLTQNTDELDKIISDAREKSLSVEWPQEEEKEDKRDYEREKLISMKIPPKYYASSFETFKGNAGLVVAVKEIKHSAMLQGKTGCGKTHLAMAWLKEKPIGMVVSIPELLLKLRGSFRDDATLTEGQIIDRYSSIPYLVLDDLGAEKSTEFSIASLYLIIERRINTEVPTLITTNLTLAEIEHKLSARIASRLSEMKIIKINMPDYRKKR